MLVLRYRPSRALQDVQGGKRKRPRTSRCCHVAALGAGLRFAPWWTLAGVPERARMPVGPRRVPDLYPVMGRGILSALRRCERREARWAGVCHGVWSSARPFVRPRLAHAYAYGPHGRRGRGRWTITHRTETGHERTEGRGYPPSVPEGGDTPRLAPVRSQIRKERMPIGGKRIRTRYAPTIWKGCFDNSIR
jgi:hypothetical protein